MACQQQEKESLLMSFWRHRVIKIKIAIDENSTAIFIMYFDDIKYIPGRLLSSRAYFRLTWYDKGEP